MMNDRLTLKKWIQDQDLRRINHMNLGAKAAGLRLRDGEMVLFTNTTLSRVRAIARIDGLPILILFPAKEGCQVLSDLFVAALVWTARRCEDKADLADTIEELTGIRVLHAA